MRYFVRAVKYFAAFCVLYVAIVWLSMTTSGDMGVSVWDQIAATFQTTRGQLLGLAVVVLSAIYPRMGFITRRVECSLEDDSEQVENAFMLSGYKLVDEQDGRKVYRAVGIFDKIIMLFEDELTSEQYGQWVEIKGVRLGVARVYYRLGSYMQNKRRA
jgi:hypothetical protein